MKLTIELPDGLPLTDCIGALSKHAAAIEANGIRIVFGEKAEVGDLTFAHQEIAVKAWINRVRAAADASAESYSSKL